MKATISSSSSLTKSTTVAAYTLGALLTGTAIIYFLAASEELSYANEEQAAMPESILFLGSGIGYAVVAGWIMLNLRHHDYGRYNINKLPYVLAMDDSVFLIALYTASRTVEIPTVGLQTDVGTLDMMSKVLQGGVVVLSAYVMLGIRKLEHTTREMHA